jgi:hypothetical protein
MAHVVDDRLVSVFEGDAAALVRWAVGLYFGLGGASYLLVSLQVALGGGGPAAAAAATPAAAPAVPPRCTLLRRLPRAVVAWCMAWCASAPGLAAREALAVVLAKVADSFKDVGGLLGAKLQFELLLHALPFDDGAALPPELLGFTVLVFLLGTLQLRALRQLPRWWYGVVRGGGGVPRRAETTGAIVAQLFCGRWGQLVGIAMWTVVASLLGGSYVGGYERGYSRWLVCALILACWLRRAAIVAAAAGPKATLSRPGGSSSGGRAGKVVAARRRRCAALRDVLWDVVFLSRQQLAPAWAALLASSSLRWSFALGVRYALQYSFPELREEGGAGTRDMGALMSLRWGVTAASYVLLLLLELLTRHCEALHSRWVQPETIARRLAAARDDSTGGAGCAGDDEQRPLVPVLLHATESMLRLTLCYVCSFVWVWSEDLRHADGTLASLPLEAYQTCACLSAVALAAWGLNTQRAHGTGHGAACVCSVCAPEYYDEAAAAPAARRAEPAKKEKKSSALRRGEPAKKEKKSSALVVNKKGIRLTFS